MMTSITFFFHAFLILATAMSKSVTIKEYDGHGCNGDPTDESTYEITMGCTSGNVLSSFQSTCDHYTFKLTYESFFGSTICEKVCENQFCYNKVEMYSGVCEDYTYEILGVQYLKSQRASFDCYSESWFFYLLLTFGFLLCCCVPCCCGYYCAKMRK